MAEEQAKLPPTPEVLPDLPYYLAREASDVAGGEYNDHYARAYKTLTEQRDTFADMSMSLRDGLREGYLTEARESAVQLSGWDLAKKMTQEAHGRALDKWEHQRVIWEDVKKRLSLASGKNVGDLAMERCDEYRKKLEALAHLDMAVPLTERDGDNQWAMSLRDNWTRFVSVGNIFSGLFVMREEKIAKDPLQVRRPHNPEDGISYQQMKGRSVLDSKFMKIRRKKYEKNIRDILPGEHGEDVAALEVVGEGMEETLARQGSKDITLEDLEEQIAQDSLETWAAIQKFRADRAAEAANAAAAAAYAAEEAEATRLSKLGPHCQLSAARVAVTAAAGSPAHAVVTVRNTGTTALYYNWRRDAPALAEHATSKGSDAFYMADVGGSLLPGEEREMMWTFKSRSPGVFLDRWQLETRPALREGPAPPVVLKGTALSEDANSYPRRMLAAELAHKEMVHKVTTAVSKVFKRVSTPEPSAYAASSRAAAAGITGGVGDFAAAPPPHDPDSAKWRAGNHGRRPRVYFSTEVFGTVRDVYVAAYEAEKVLNPTSPGGAEEGAEDAEKEASPAEGEEGYVPPPPEPTPAELWDGSVGAAEAAVEALAAAIAANPDWTPPPWPPEPEEGSPKEGEEGYVPPPPPPPTPSEVLERCKADLARASVAAALPASRAGVLQSALSESLATALEGMDAAAAEAMVAHGPPKPSTPPPAEENAEAAEEAPPAAEGDAAEGEGGGEAAAADGTAAVEEDTSWREAYVEAMREKVAAMLGAAVDAFETVEVAQADDEVNAECERRVSAIREAEAADNSGDLGEQGEWDVYAMLRRRKALLGREP